MDESPSSARRRPRQSAAERLAERAAGLTLASPRSLISGTILETPQSSVAAGTTGSLSSFGMVSAPALGGRTPRGRSGGTMSSSRYSMPLLGSGVGRRSSEPSAPAREVAGGFFTFPKPYNEKTPVHLRLLEKEEASDLCLSFVGKRKICLKKRLKHKNHCGDHRASKKKYKFPEGEGGVWLIPAPHFTLFESPSLRDLEVLSRHRKQVERAKKTTLEWAECLAEYKEDFDLAQVEVREGGGDEEDGSDSEGSSSEEDEDDDGEEGEDVSRGESSQGNGLLDHLLENEFGSYQQTVPPALEAPVYEGGEVETANPTVHTNAQAVRVTRLALDMLATQVHAMNNAAAEEGARLAEFFCLHIDSVIDVVNLALNHLDDVINDVGDVSTLEGYSSIAAAVGETLEAVGPQGQLHALQTKAKQLEDLIHAVDEDLQEEIVRSGEVTIEAVQACLDRLQGASGIPSTLQIPNSQAPGGGGQGQFQHVNQSQAPAGQYQSPPALLSSAMVYAANGAPQGTLQSLIDEIRSLRTDVDALKTAMGEQSVLIAKLERNLLSQGGLVFREFNYGSEADLEALVAKECPNAEGCIAAFPTGKSIFVHDEQYNPTSTWYAATKTVISSGQYTPAEAKFIHSHGVPIPSHYATSGMVKPGKVLNAFDSRKTWRGYAGVPGQKMLIEESLNRASSAHGTYVTQSDLPVGSELARLAHAMAMVTRDWHGKVLAFLDNDLTKLVELNVSEDETLLLLSEYIIIMFNDFDNVEQLLPAFKLSANKADYLVKVIVVAIKVHARMDHFLGHGNMQYVSEFAAGFVRFLTKNTAQHSATGLSKRVADLEAFDQAKLKKDLGTLTTTVGAQGTSIKKLQDELKKKKDK